MAASRASVTSGAVSADAARRLGVSFVCGLLFLIWITDAGILYGFMVGPRADRFRAPAAIEQMVMDYAGYSAIMGGVLAFILFAVSAFSIPLIYDGARRWSRASWRAYGRCSAASA